MMEEVKLPSPDIKDLKNIFPNMLLNSFSDFITGMGVTDCRHYDR